MSTRLTNEARTPVIGLLLITVLAVCVQGYHLGADDAAIYVPGIKKVADPGLYSFGNEFFQSLLLVLVKKEICIC